MADDSLLTMLEREGSEEEFDLYTACGEIADREGWSRLVREALDVLADLSKSRYWLSAITVLFWSPIDQVELPTPRMQVVARLCWCLLHWGEGYDGGDLVWSIASALKGVGFGSDWDPQKDPEVLGFLGSMGG